MKEAIPTHKYKNFNIISKEIKDKITKRNRLRKIINNNRNLDLKKEINQMNSEIKKQIKTDCNKNWDKKLEKASTKDNTLWRLTKNLTKKQTKIRCLHGPNGLVYSDQQKAEVLADNFEKVHHLTENFGEDIFERKVAEEVQKIKETPVDLNEIKYVSPREIKKAIKKTKSKKAPGCDKIQNIILKNLPHRAIVYIANIFNASF